MSVNAFIERDVAGENRRFGKLTPYDRSGILGRLRDSRRAKLIENAKLLPPEQAFSVIEEFDDQAPYSAAQFIDYINTPEGHAAVLDIALKKAYGDEAQSIAEQLILSPADELRLVAELCNLTMRDTPQPEGDGNENPSARVGFGT